MNGEASAENCPTFRPILWALNTPTYKLAKFLVPILKLLTTNEFIDKDAFHFTGEIVINNMISLWVVSM